MTNQTFPFVTVVIVTFNRSKHILPCLESLAKQTYPKDKYEIIVVDDGSTDDTASIVREQGVHIISHSTNQGIPSARNTGLNAAQGEITAYIDDDAVADPRWLEYLMQPFERPDVTGSGGQTFAYKTEYITERYLSAVGYGNPAPLAFGQSKDPFWRFWIYLKSMFMPITTNTKPIEVEAIFTLNAAYQTLALRNIGGFDDLLLSDEDADVSTRLRRTGAHIIFIPSAIIYHRHRENFKQLVRQTYHRAKNTLLYYTKEKKILPIFPLPLLYIVLAICLIIIQPITGIIFVIIGPAILYSWWTIRSFRTGNIEYFVYGYIQLTLESATIFGLVYGKLENIRIGKIYYGLRDRLVEHTSIFMRDLKYLSKIFSTKPLLCYLGWVGYGNLGDELLFIAHQKLFPDYEIIPYHKNSLLGFFTKLNKKHFKAGILGGGTLINLPGVWLQDTRSILKLNLPVFALGTGVNFKLKNKTSSVISESIERWSDPLNKFIYLGVRGPISAKILNMHLKKPAEIIGDTALALAPETYLTPVKTNIIGMCVGYSKEIPLTVDAQKYIEIIVSYIRTCIDKGFEINLLPVWYKDVEFNENILREVNDSRCILMRADDDYTKYLSEVSKCTVFVGQKLHGTVIATMMRVPSIMIAYHPKCFDYMKSIHMEDWDIPIETLTFDMLLTKTLELLQKQNLIRSSLDTVVMHYHTMQYEKARQLENQFMK